MWPRQLQDQIPTGQPYSLPQKQEKQAGLPCPRTHLIPVLGLALASGQMPPLGPKEPPGGLGCPLWAGVLGSGWPAAEFNNSNSESKRFHPSCLWAEEERKEEGEEGVEGAG